MQSFNKDPFATGSTLSWKVAAVISEEAARALQWVLDSSSMSSDKIELTRISLADIKSCHSEYDAFLIALDLGQPVPVEHLKSIQGRVGLCAILQPTPLQLLNVAREANWRAVQWNAGDHQQLAKDLFETIDVLKDQIKKTILLESVENWVAKKIKVPARLSLVDPPDEFRGSDSAALVLSKGLVSVGAEDSPANIRLPIKGRHSFFEVYNLQGQWQWRKVVHGGVHVDGPDSKKVLEAGDVFRVENYEFAIKSSRSVEELLGILHQAGLRSEQNLTLPNSEVTNIQELLKEFMLSAMSGELRVSSPTKKASIFIEGGRIQQILCGSVFGLKALLRVFSWKDFKWSFNLYAQAELNLPALDLSYLELKNLYSQWSSRWEKVGSLIPTSSVKLQISPESFSNRQDWSKSEYIVMASVCEFRNVSEILNNCPLWDVEIIEVLVLLRRQKIIVVD